MKKSIFSIMIVILFQVTGFSQTKNEITVEVQTAESIREISEKYLGDPDLWEQILKFNGLSSVVDVKPGMKIKIPVNVISRTNSMLEKSLKNIQKASNSGARLFAVELIVDAVALIEQAQTYKKGGEWENSFDLATRANKKALDAYNESQKKVNIKTKGIISDKGGSVNVRKAGKNVWSKTQLNTILIENDEIRTLSNSYAEIMFRNGSRFRMNENSLVKIEKMRANLLKENNESSVILVKGDLSAYLSTLGRNDRFDLSLSGVKTKINSKSFWVSQDGQETRFANYEGEIEVTSGGKTVRLIENQGTKVSGGNAPAALLVLLLPPNLILPAEATVLYNQEIDFEWEPVEGAISYFIEISSDHLFQTIIQKKYYHKAIKLTTRKLEEGIYFWRVKAIDSAGFPGSYGEAHFFEIAIKKKAPYIVIRSPRDNFDE